MPKLNYAIIWRLGSPSIDFPLKPLIFGNYYVYITVLHTFLEKNLIKSYNFFKIKNKLVNIDKYQKN